MTVRDCQNGDSPLAAELPPSPFLFQHTLRQGCSITGLATVGVGLLSLLLLGTWCLVVGPEKTALPLSTLGRSGLQHAWTPPPPPRAGLQLNAAAAQHPDVAEICSAEFRRRHAELVDNGTQGPAVLQWGCPGIEACGGGPAQSLINSYRQRRMADVLHLLPCDLYKQFQGRTLWIMGDSQHQYFYRQLRCFLRPLLEKGDAPRTDAPLTTDPSEVKLIEEKILRGYCCGVAMPICTYLVGGARLCHVRVNKAAHFVEDYLPNLRLLNVSRDDIVVFNFGLWHHIRDGDYPGIVQRLADYIQANRTQLPTMIWRDSSPQHFAIKNGEFPHPDEATAKLGGGSKKCVPIDDVLLTYDGTLWGKNEHVKLGGWRNIISNPIMRAAGVHMLASWNETVTTTWNMHTGGECSHFCAPGGYSIWTWQLWQLLRGLPLRAGEL